MDKICIIFRGLNYRIRSESGSPLEVNALSAVDNWKKAIYQDLDEHGIKYDTVFITYPSSILQQLIDAFSPTVVMTEGYDSQMTNMRAVGQFMLDHKDEYTKFIILRFDFWYKIKITQWPHFESLGITLANKDHSFDTMGYYSDFLFQVGSESAHTFLKMLNKCDGVPHAVGAHMIRLELPFNVMYEGTFYYSKDHPMYCYLLDPKPEL